MENLTNVVEDVVTDVAEEVVTKVSLGTVATGVCAATGAVAIVYGTIKGAKWLYKKVKAGKNNQSDILDADDEELSDAKEVDED